MPSRSVDESKIIDMYRAGAPIRDIMRAVGIRSVALIYKVLADNRIPTRRKKRPGGRIPEEVRKKICELRAKGWSYPRIAKELGISLGSAYRIFKKECPEGNGSSQF